MRLGKDQSRSRQTAEIPDGLLTGLYFVVQPSGKEIMGGSIPRGWQAAEVHARHISRLDLAKAAPAAKETLQRVQKGEDPAAAKQAERRASKDGDTADRQRFDKIVRIFLARYAKPNNRSWKETARTLGLFPDKTRAGHD